MKRASISASSFLIPSSPYIKIVIQRWYIAMPELITYNDNILDDYIDRSQLHILTCEDLIRLEEDAKILKFLILDALIKKSL